ncbi:MAG TPA: hypothetical protein VF662_13970 [Allosphingosinicella sp.]|jgi:hypothetical protein
MRRSTIRFTGASLLLLPLMSTCTQPQGSIASAREHVQLGSEERLMAFLIDGSNGAVVRR